MANEKTTEATVITYKYKVIERTFKENLLMKEGEPFESTTLYNSRALVAADDVTAEAVRKLKAEHEAHYKKAAPISNDESGRLRDEVAELKATLAEALGALKQAAASKK